MSALSNLKTKQFEMHLLQNKLAKFRRHASGVHFAKIHFKKYSSGRTDGRTDTLGHFNSEKVPQTIRARVETPQNQAISQHLIGRMASGVYKGIRDA